MLGACIAGGLAACASPPPPREQLAVGRGSIDAALAAGASELAPVELERARTKFNQAQLAARDGNMVAARRLAESADADAQVARSKAQAERSKKAADEITAGLRTLRQQLALPAQPAELMPDPPAAGQPGAPNQNGTLPNPPSQPSIMPPSGVPGGPIKGLDQPMPAERQR